MALKNKSSFLYGFEISKFNCALDFRASLGGPVLLATIPFGFYTATGLMSAIKFAMETADPLNKYTVTLIRVGSTVKIKTNGNYLDLLFGTGPRTATSICDLIGYTRTDKAGALEYQGQISCGVKLTPEYVGYSYLSPDFMRTVFGAINVSANGTKETIVWSVQKFFQVEFKYEPEAKAIAEWMPFLTWAIQQKPLEFTPDITNPDTYYQCTLESTGADGKGLGFKLEEMLPDFPFYYKTGMLKFRQKN